MGETRGQREAMDRFVRRLVDAGISAREAKEKARQEAIKSDRRKDKKP